MMLPRINTADMTTRKSILLAGVLVAAAALLWAAAPPRAGAQQASAPDAASRAAIDAAFDEAPEIPAELLRGVQVRQRQEQLELLTLETRLANQVFAALQNEARLLQLLDETQGGELQRLHDQYQQNFFPERAGRGPRTRGVAAAGRAPTTAPTATAAESPEEELALAAGCGCLQSRVHWIGYDGDNQAILSHELIASWMRVSGGERFGECSVAVTPGAEEAPDQGEVLLQCGGIERTLTLRNNEGTG